MSFWRGECLFTPKRNGRWEEQKGSARNNSIRQRFRKVSMNKRHSSVGAVGGVQIMSGTRNGDVGADFSVNLGRSSSENAVGKCGSVIAHLEKPTERTRSQNEVMALMLG